MLTASRKFRSGNREFATPRFDVPPRRYARGMLDIVLEALYRLFVATVWILMAWKVLWLIVLGRDTIRYLRTRELGADLRRALVYVGILEKDDE